MQTHPPEKYIIGQDGSAWLLDKQNSDEPYLIRKKALDETEWTTYTIPEYYKCEDGIVVLPAVSRPV